MSVHKKRILIVDDEIAICQFCQRVLAEEEFEVDISFNGRAQSVISEQEYDLYLLDIKMPVIGGRDIYKWLQEMYPHIAAKVIFITGSAIGEDTESFLQSSGRQVLFKPFTIEELKATVTQTLKAVHK